jgi:surface protein
MSSNIPKRTHYRHRRRTNNRFETKITDENIHALVNTYLSNKSELPEDLRNKPIGNWEVKNVTDMNKLFYYKSSFNEPLNEWKVGNVTNMESMFWGCEEFNQPLNKWHVNNVKNMKRMFQQCYKFDQNLNDWKVGKVTDMGLMFLLCDNFNQPLNEWNVSNVTDMNNMFRGCEKFNQDINFDESNNTWNVSNVINMQFMFSGCLKFNKPLNKWNIENVTNMRYMFAGAERYNKPLNNWIITERTDSRDMFNNCRIQRQNKPTFILNGITIREPIIEDVDMNHIHKFAGNINYSETILFLKEKIKKNIDFENINYKEYISNNLLDIFSVVYAKDNTSYHKYISFSERKPSRTRSSKKIKSSSEPKLSKKNKSSIKNKISQKNKKIEKEIEEKEIEEKRKNLKNILKRLNTISMKTYKDISPIVRECMFYSLEYVKTQPYLFQKLYIDSFIKDSGEAFKKMKNDTSDDNTLSCIGGMIERLITSLLFACKSEDNNKEYEDLEKIMNIANIIQELIIDWYKLHNNREENIDRFPDDLSEMSEMKRRKNLEEFLLSKQPNQKELIDEKIKERADYIGYTNDVFTYGGKRIKTSKQRKIINQRKTSKQRK